MATATKNSTTTAPTMAPRRLTRRRTARRQGCDSGVAAALVSIGTSEALSGTQARVDEEIGEVGEQIEQDIRRRGEEHDALHHGVIAVEHGVDDELAEA